MATAPGEVFYRHIGREIRWEGVTPFLGADVNLCGRPRDAVFHPGEWLPSGKELARHLAREFAYPNPKSEAELDDLVRIAQWVSVKLGKEALYAELHDIFDRDYRPTAIHRTLARLPAYVERQGRPEYPLIVTANYDDALEEALVDAGVEFDLLTYVVTGEHRGRFRHDFPDGRTKVVQVPDKYDGVSLQRRTVVVKVRGSVKRDARSQDEDSYVVAEDDYIECLTRTDIFDLLPSNVVARMQHCHYLFLGYSVKDWNLRAILHRIRRDGVLGHKSWVLQPNPDELELKAWERRNVETLDITVEEFAQALDGYLSVTHGAAPPSPPKYEPTENTMSVPPQHVSSQRVLPACPYRGLMPYTEDDAEYFFGRDREIGLIVDNLKAYRLTVLYGPSGVGKTSVLLAGVVRRMHDEEEESLATFGVRESVVVYCNHWRDDPALALGSLARRGFSKAYPDAELALPELALPDRLEAAALAAACDALDVDVYLVLDQFEEYCLYHDDDAPGRAFVAELSAISAAATRVNLLIALRDDAFTRLDRFEGHVPRLFDKTLRLDHLDYKSAREAVLRPLQRYNELASRDDRMEIEPELVDRVLDQVRAGRIRIGGASDGEAVVAASSTPECRIEAPFLQLILTRVWSEERAQSSRVLRVKTLNDLGGAEQIVRTHLDSVMSELPDDEQEVAAHIFRHLVTPSGMKIGYTAADLTDYAEVPDRLQVTEVLERLSAGNERVLRPVPPPVDQPGAPRYEIFHDVMAPAVLDWRRRYVAARERADSERALVRAKNEAEERDRQSRRRLRRSRVLSATLALFVVLLALALVVN